MDAVSEFRRITAQLVGKKAWGVRMGTAWHFSMSWGGEVVRPGRQHAPEGEFKLIVSGSWRVESEDRILSTWRKWEANGHGPTAFGGRTVTAVDLLVPGMDLVIGMGRDRTLRIFTDREAAFMFFTPEWAFSVNQEGLLEMDR